MIGALGICGNGAGCVGASVACIGASTCCNRQPAKTTRVVSTAQSTRRPAPPCVMCLAFAGFSLVLMALLVYPPSANRPREIS